MSFNTQIKVIGLAAVEFLSFKTIKNVNSKAPKKPREMRGIY
jgi:hypothetical protein